MRTRRCVTTAMIALSALMIVGSPGALAQDGNHDSAVPPTERPDCIATPVCRRSFFSGGRDDVASPGKQRQT